MPVEDYVAQAALWASPQDGDTAALLLDHGQLDPDRLAAAALEHPNAYLFLRYAPKALQGREARAWRKRPDRPKFTGVSRLAAVGLLGRFISSGMRLSLMLRGTVPGGLSAAAQQQYGATLPVRHAYHAHVSTDGGYLIIQYWFLYAMNDWRSGFSGVNDHEADWEQVTVYLASDGTEAASEDPDRWVLSWVAFSSHDEAGDELRRRPDDPDISWVDDTHPVVNVGAGSHSGAYLAGDYLVRVQPLALRRTFGVFTSVRSLVFPWAPNGPFLGIGIPYVDYRRGDGIHIGPGTSRPWTPILIDSSTPWVRDYRGLWGLDTADRFGGERAPAGPRYERNGAIRASWADPVGWAGLDKIPPNRAARAAADAARIAELDARINELDAKINTGQRELRRAVGGIEVLPPTVTSADGGDDGAATRLAARELALRELRSQRRSAVNERDQLRHVRSEMLYSPPHAHLRHRAVPEKAVAPGLLLRFWSGASLSVLLFLLGVALLFDLGPLFLVVGIAILVVMAVEALLRGRLFVFLPAVAIIAAVSLLIWLVVTQLRIALGVLALAAAVASGIANLRDLLTRR
ncbi:hypothetical protein AB0B45_46125 [Nonomuraea sp. NPDC049152]|uniref:hypothetical protein n=1 Tax=Nonomuraea sp. NPDC049152 TaxID=3154350 RepID=UPI0033D1E0B2